MSCRLCWTESLVKRLQKHQEEVIANLSSLFFKFFKFFLVQATNLRPTFSQISVMVQQCRKDSVFKHVWSIIFECVKVCLWPFQVSGLQERQSLPHHEMSLGLCEHTHLLKCVWFSREHREHHIISNKCSRHALVHDV